MPHPKKSMELHLKMDGEVRLEVWMRINACLSLKWEEPHVIHQVGKKNQVHPKDNNEKINIVNLFELNLDTISIKVLDKGLNL
jgi:hypothetical protein